MYMLSTYIFTSEMYASHMRLASQSTSQPASHPQPKACHQPFRQILLRRTRYFIHRTFIQIKYTPLVYYVQRAYRNSRRGPPHSSSAPRTQINCCRRPPARVVYARLGGAAALPTNELWKHINADRLYSRAHTHTLFANKTHICTYI